MLSGEYTKYTKVYSLFYYRHITYTFLLKELSETVQNKNMKEYNIRIILWGRLEIGNI